LPTALAEAATNSTITLWRCDIGLTEVNPVEPVSNNIDEYTSSRSAKRGSLLMGRRTLVRSALAKT
jgi:hypothetical protein